MPRSRNLPKAMTLQHVLSEVNQAHETRRPLYRRLEDEIRKTGKNVKVVAFFTSFVFPVAVADFDADMIEEVLQNTDLDKSQELVLLINSPGGEALPAERIVNICRTYSNGRFSVIVPKAAKSAATMICLGARKIVMSKTSELGPIDPQIEVREGDSRKYFAAHEIIESYDELINKANRTRGRIEPFLQQLSRFDARDIRRIRSAQDLSESIAIRCLKSGIFSGSSDGRIRTKIRPFLEPKLTKVHGRPIYPDLAQACGLNVDIEPEKSRLWQVVWKLYVRLNYVVSHTCAKVIESSEHFWFASP